MLVSVVSTRTLYKVAVDEANQSWTPAGSVEFPAGKPPVYTVFSADSQRAYVSTMMDGIVIVDVPSMTILRTLPTDGFVACGMIKPSADADHAVVAAGGHGGHIYTLDMTSDTLEDRGTLGAMSWHSFNMTPDEALGFGTSPNSDEVVIIDLTTDPVTNLGTIVLQPLPGHRQQPTGRRGRWRAYCQRHPARDPPSFGPVGIGEYHHRQNQALHRVSRAVAARHIQPDELQRLLRPRRQRQTYRGATERTSAQAPRVNAGLSLVALTSRFITTKTNGVFRSFDGGHTFAASSVGLGSLTMGRAAKVTIDPTNTRVMCVGSEAHGGGAVYKSYDRGDHWSAANEGIESVAVFALAMDPNEPSVLYVTGSDGTYKTTSGGESR